MVVGAMSQEDVLTVEVDRLVCAFGDSAHGRTIPDEQGRLG